MHITASPLLSALLKTSLPMILARRARLSIVLIHTKHHDAHLSISDCGSLQIRPYRGAATHAVLSTSLLVVVDGT